MQVGGRRGRAHAAIVCAVAVAVAVPAASAQVPVPVPPLVPPGQQPPPPRDPPRDPAPPVPAGSPPTGSVTRQIDGGHTGFLDDPNLVPPLRVRWTRKLEGMYQPALAAEGRIYAGTAGGIRALDPATGRDVWASGVRGGLAAYDSGRLILITDGGVRAISAADGSPLWEKELSRYESPLTAVGDGGVVYTMAGSVLYTLSGADGSQLWSAQSTGPGAPSVDRERVYTMDGCGQVRAFDRRNGAKLWDYVTGCSGGGSSTAATVRDGRVMVALRGFNATNGQRLPDHPGTRPPVLGPGFGIFTRGGELSQLDPGTLARRWRFIHEKDETQRPELAPIVIHRSVYRVYDGRLYAVGLDSGRVQWRAREDYTSNNPNEEIEALSAAPGVLLATSSDRLTAYESEFQPPPDGIDSAANPAEIVHGRTTVLAGAVGPDRRDRVKRVRFQQDRAPFGEVGAGPQAPVRADGYFEVRARPDRNTRYRATGNGASSSKTFVVYVYPRVGYRARAAGQRVAVTVSVRAAADVRLGGRRAFVYYGRGGSSTLRRLGSTTLRSAGRGRATGTVTFRPLMNVGARDYVVTCILGQAKLGLGRNDRFARGCGRATNRF